jgi:hypothetical protein
MPSGGWGSPSQLVIRLKNPELTPLNGSIVKLPPCYHCGNPRWSAIGFLWLVVICCILPGCNQGPLKTYPVQGKFVYEDGTFPKFGDIEFYSETHRINARGVIERDGTFTVSTFRKGDGAVAGKHKIIVTQNLASPLTARIRQEIDHDHGKIISLQYNDYRTTDLECEITPKGINRIELVVKPNPRQTEDGLPLD